MIKNYFIKNQKFKFFWTIRYWWK